MPYINPKLRLVSVVRMLEKKYQPDTSEWEESPDSTRVQGMTIDDAIVVLFGITRTRTKLWAEFKKDPRAKGRAALGKLLFLDSNFNYRLFPEQVVQTIEEYNLVDDHGNIDRASYLAYKAKHHDE